MVVIENLLTPEEVSRFREVLSSLPWSDGKATAMGMAAAVKNNHQADASNPGVQRLANQLLARLGETPAFISAALPHRIFPPVFNRYSETEEYGFHVDAAIMRIPGTTDVLRSDVSMTLFLNEPEEYDGGELIVATEFGEQSVKLPSGSAVVYPSSSLHKVTAVTRGQRLAAITWIQSMVSDTSARRSLYELDQSIQRLLHQGQVDRAELDRLHCVYHNLVRQFAVI
ncbi:Fe2+-dependent dioxygenase [Microbulbifer thermotolerans]|uniref:Fe2+-dependent dioxygenase n=1 Tax=Microbulbifer thermotolerans TaxID=252514 RepID=UPI0008EB899A|nr:Fe2+-dependent dioxygenase [Microbulbifer thermotolerans]MCX2778405.1 Fe2+-dependent dioxygenase [Microbulbifer thermotolerans]MCX2784177.1 Fe2+-dependent dioxygenase [Microbulbifer thermotolerans]MCX2796174.1 Fe2+-dependent dioxygenase [Microbulbifer thermotolerans]MCX2804444.1 Fe2+-dependent dioxygenase [Microbulbifer thermotolerans]MCX2832592.1 Fe2+-dependent dioxygenase [Microbulbifer thermotolerans]